MIMFGFAMVLTAKARDNGSGMPSPPSSVSGFSR